ncbi:MAG: ABC transporter permease [Christensenellales bacterium]
MNKKKHRPNAATIFGLIIIGFFVVVALLAEHIAPHDPSALGTAYLPPSAEHLLGTNDLGQDIFSELVFGTRVSLVIGIFSALAVTLIGTVLALTSGYYGGWWDRLVAAITDITMAIPSLPLTMLLIAYLQSGMFSLIIAMSVTAWTGTTRILRSRVKQICEQPYIKIEKTLGVRTPVILFKHILPNLKDILLTRMALSVSGAMMTESGLSFLGLGTFGQKSWGNILHFAFFRNSILRKQVWWYLPPIICISIAVLGFMLVGYYGQQRAK